MVSKVLKIVQNYLVGDKFVSFILNIRMLLGFNTDAAHTCFAGFAQRPGAVIARKGLQCCIAFYCIIIFMTVICLSCIVIKAMFSGPNSNWHIFIISMQLSEYIIFFVGSFMYKDVYFHTFVSTLKLIDAKTNFQAKTDENKITKWLFYIVILTLFSLRVIYVYKFPPELVVIIIFEMLLKIVITVTAWYRIIIFEMLWRRMRYQRKMLDIYLNDFEWHTAEDKANRIKEFGLTYMELLDALMATGHILKLQVIVELVITFWRSLICAYLIKTTPPLLIQFAYVLEMAVMITVALAPVVLMECAASEVDGARAAASRQLLWGETAVEDAAEDALRCLALRPCRYSMWRAARLDARLPLALAALCASYVILLVQILDASPTSKSVIWNPSNNA